MSAVSSACDVVPNHYLLPSLVLVLPKVNLNAAVQSAEKQCRSHAVSQAHIWWQQSCLICKQLQMRHGTRSYLLD